jgi:hypothetical protein
MAIEAIFDASRYGIAAFAVRTARSASDVELLAPRVLVVLDRQRRHIGHHDVDTAEGLGAGRHPGFERGLIRHVERLPEGGHALGAQRFDRFLDLRRVARADRDMGSLIGEDVRAAPADAFLPPVTMAFRPFSPRSIILPSSGYSTVTLTTITAVPAPSKALPLISTTNRSGPV